MLFSTIYPRRIHVKDNVSRQTYPFNLPDLPYAYDALEPHIDGKTLRIHHHEHHGTYVKKLNEALSGTAQLQKLTLAELLSDTDKLPAAIRAAVKNNGGGHFNHDLFWRSMTPSTSREPRGEFATALEQTLALSKRFARSSATPPPNISRVDGSRSHSCTRRKNLSSSNSRITRWCAQPMPP